MSYMVMTNIGNVKNREDGRFKAVLKIIMRHWQLFDKLVQLSGAKDAKDLEFCMSICDNNWFDKHIRASVHKIVAMCNMRIIDERAILMTNEIEYDVVVGYTVEWDDFPEDKDKWIWEV